ncbi:hypothetical protein PQ472_11485 [Lacticaseibacillus pabuli]|uniref:Phosphatidate cytidylyltransferase n=1 Tax=Lacticaseibacillus pabuli TaxID=3025672 RepID=A0ABY7WQN5_9LACO|nr:hypothetical protein [Lacticaseibacillus sp. KACC 23028]WDF82500.1 hypothetical protein PQ472_11485 [Lacticaseibacillus sp. KACC 23028]
METIGASLKQRLAGAGLIVLLFVMPIPHWLFAVAVILWLMWFGYRDFVCQK